MSSTITRETLDDLISHWKEAGNSLVWPSIFVLPPWLDTWWRVFGGGMESCILAVRQEGAVIGIAPLRVQDSVLSFIGDTDVCDYEDFIVARGHEESFFNALLDDIEKRGIVRLDLKHLRPDSLSLGTLAPLAAGRGYRVDTVQEEINMEMELPADWDNYLEHLTSKQRHEVRRKLRRLQESGDISFRFIDDGASVPGVMDKFLQLFTDSRRDKAAFLTAKREAYFRLLAGNMAREGLLRLGVLELDGRTVAQIICFDYNNCIYLYNSGFDPDYISLSVGLLSKVLAIKDSIEKGKRVFDFLKGSEVYKYHLGGREVPLYRCVIDIK